jgi:hypothetical protein
MFVPDVRRICEKEGGHVRNVNPVFGRKGFENENPVAIGHSLRSIRPWAGHLKCGIGQKVSGIDYSDFGCGRATLIPYHQNAPVIRKRVRVKWELPRHGIVVNNVRSAIGNAKKSTNSIESART